MRTTVLARMTRLERSNIIAGYSARLGKEANTVNAYMGICLHQKAGRDVLKKCVRMTRAFDEVLDVKMRMGALPGFPTNSLKYNLTWSVDGRVNEYYHPCEAIRDGEQRAVELLERLEHFSLDGIEYEAFKYFGRLGTLCETLSSRVRTLDYKTVRHSDHCALMKLLLEKLRLSSHPDELKRILRASMPTTIQVV